MLNESMNHDRSKNFPVTFEREIARLLPHLERSSFFIVAVCYGHMLSLLRYSTLPPAFGVELGELDDKILATVFAYFACNCIFFRSLFVL